MSSEGKSECFPLAMAACCLLGVGSLWLHTAHAGEWTHWRGPTMNGVAQGVGYPVSWTKSRNTKWRTPLPGPAGSTPICTGGRIFLTSPDGAELVLIALNAESGEQLWRRTVSVGDATFRGDEGNLASPSPATDGDHVVAVMGDGAMACYTVSGDPVWRLNLSDRLPKLDMLFGYASSPIIRDGKIYLQWIHGDGDASTQESRAVCLELLSGETVWESQRVTGARAECENCYASPILVEAGGNELLVTHGGDYTVAYRTSDGEEQWRLGGLNPITNYHPTLRFVSSPVAADGILVVPTAKRSLVAAVSPDGRGDITDTKSQLWRAPGTTPDVPSPIIHDKYIYLCSESGVFSCLRAENGEVLYKERTVSDRHRSSPILAGTAIYSVSRKGVVTVVRPGPFFEVIDKNDLGEPMSSSPIAVDEVLYFRTFEALHAIAYDLGG